MEVVIDRTKVAKVTLELSRLCRALAATLRILNFKLRMMGSIVGKG